MKRISDSYITTLDPMSANDMQTLEMLRKTIKAVNKVSKEKQRVVVRGRKPFKKKEVYNVYQERTRTLSYDYSGNVVGGLANASRYDVYVYKV